MATPAELAGTLSRELLITLFEYDPESGCLTRKARPPTHGTRLDFRGAGEEAGFIVNRGYRYVRIKARRFAVHRLAWFLVYGEWPHGEIDHINGNTADNRIQNLRDVPRSVNAQNKRSALRTNVSGFLGVKQRGDKFYASLSVNNKTKHVGTFDTPQAAHAAYLEAKRIHHPGCTI